MSFSNAGNDILNGSNKLPTLPGVAVRILEALQKDDPDINEIGDILSTDPPLTSKILKIVNSSFYSLSSKITSVKPAINLLGLKTVQNLALSFSLVNKFRTGKSREFNYVRFWKDALIGAISAKYLAEKLAAGLSEDAFFLGLLQDIGILTVGHCFQENYHQILKNAESGKFSPFEAETMVLGVNHMEIGEYLTKSWGLPEHFYKSIGYHHCPDKAMSEQKNIYILSKILFLSSLCIEFFNDASDENLEITHIWMRNYGFADSNGIETVKYITDQAQIIFPLFEFDFDSEADYTNLLEQTKEQLADLSEEMIADLIDQKHHVELLKKEVGRDAMTHLYNQTRFREKLDREIMRAERYKTELSIIIGDIDHFKFVNDTYGHLAGDRVIKAVASSLKNHVRDSDVVARYGGEEFAVILPQTASDRAFEAAERLRKKIASLEITYENQTIAITMSFGIASLQNEENMSADDLIREADKALYHAKSAGRNRSSVVRKNNNLKIIRLFNKNSHQSIQKRSTN